MDDLYVLLFELFLKPAAVSKLAPIRVFYWLCLLKILTCCG